MKLHHGCLVWVEGRKGILCYPLLMTPQLFPGIEIEKDVFPGGWGWGFVLWTKAWYGIHSVSQLQHLPQSEYFTGYDDEDLKNSLKTPFALSVGVINLSDMLYAGELSKHVRRRGKRHRMRPPAVVLEDL